MNKIIPSLQRFTGNLSQGWIFKDLKMGLITAIRSLYIYFIAHECKVFFSYVYIFFFLLLKAGSDSMNRNPFMANQMFWCITSSHCATERWKRSFQYLILGLQCLKNWRNLGIMMRRGRLSASLSSSSDESSQIFCSAPNEPWDTDTHTERLSNQKTQTHTDTKGEGQQLHQKRSVSCSRRRRTDQLSVWRMFLMVFRFTGEY